MKSARLSLSPHLENLAASSVDRVFLLQLLRVKILRSSLSFCENSPGHHCLGAESGEWNLKPPESLPGDFAKSSLAKSHWDFPNQQNMQLMGRTANVQKCILRADSLKFTLCLKILCKAWKYFCKKTYRSDAQTKM